MRTLLTTLLIFLSTLSISVGYCKEMPTPQKWTFNAYNQPIVIAKNNNLAALVLSNELLELHRLDIKCDLPLENSINKINLIVNEQPVKFITYCNNGKRTFTPETEEGIVYIIFLFQNRKSVQLDELVFTTTNFKSITEEWKKMDKESI